ncbi:hypothetical protein E6Q11_03325 [Candidatus Dojkabacteria bacterium]|uniref:Uncharacterized protein n=1 Tax=Candidatus Dojkabacteria bacterium TaxID=2099670 RepID=A0A5C7J988_9BACT|nr:MAG: hypothetical protein E6Q11_03325 [Candidatus Dojkabacteria bacterium]
MTIQEVETQLKKIDENITVRANENSDLAGVYWKDTYTYISMPKDDVRPKRTDMYCDSHGVPHRGFAEVVERVKAFVEQIQDPSYMEYLTEEFDDDIEQYRANLEKERKLAEQSKDTSSEELPPDSTQPIA